MALRPSESIYAVWDLGKKLSPNDLEDLEYMHWFEAEPNGIFKIILPGGGWGSNEDMAAINAETEKLETRFPKLKMLGIFYEDGTPI